MARVEHIHVSAVAGGPMRGLDEAFLRAGSGLSGDRYAIGRGHWTDRNVSRDVTLVESEVIEELARSHGIGLPPAPRDATSPRAAFG
jgi:hypothetical protein